MDNGKENFGDNWLFSHAETKPEYLKSLGISKDKQAINVVGTEFDQDFDAKVNLSAA